MTLNYIKDVIQINTLKFHATILSLAELGIIMSEIVIVNKESVFMLSSFYLAQKAALTL